MKRALVLFAHGARAQSWAAPFERLREQSQSRLPGVPVRLAFLELMEPRLPAAIDALVAEGVGEIAVVPVFLGQGGHLLRDLPQLAEGIRAAHPGLRLEVAGAIGEDPQVQAAMTDYCIRALG
ncbi:sirohydrochlorin chelatase [Massilia sp. UBA6681]|uniref:sirohydrochlorin chelatase n=1 Tax=Massilia sp. UBA6681 TaxID=1946839 RepID=UPI0025BCDA74|nr:CbiX/SirB N-terminal domain-containing protein [Massilia sp. UBA6681]